MHAFINEELPMNESTLFDEYRETSVMQLRCVTKWSKCRMNETNSIDGYLEPSVMHSRLWVNGLVKEVKRNKIYSRDACMQLVTK